MSAEIFLYYPEGHEVHQVSQHPERPERIEVIRQALVERSWWATGTPVQPVGLTDEVLHRIHDPGYLAELRKTCENGQWYDQDTYLLPQSCELAMQTAGGAAQLVKEVWDQPGSSGFALCRPPGHHATRYSAMGFCLLNNAALAGEYLLQNSSAERLAILDFDLHHGNGTQDIFWERGDVLYLSTHQSPLYPGTGHLNEIGEGDGRFATANLPLPPGTGDEGYATCMQSFVLPVLDRFQPEMLIISIGFDAHWKDPLGFLQLTAAGYGNLIGELRSWAGSHCSGRIALILEGGYNLEAVSACTQTVIGALLGEPVEDPIGRSSHTDTTRWRSVLEQAKDIWQI